MKAMLESGRQVRKHLFFFELNMMVGSRSKKKSLPYRAGIKTNKKVFKKF